MVVCAELLTPDSVRPSNSCASIGLNYQDRHLIESSFLKGVISVICKWPDHSCIRTDIYSTHHRCNEYLGRWGQFASPSGYHQRDNAICW